MSSNNSTVSEVVASNTNSNQASDVVSNNSMSITTKVQAESPSSTSSPSPPSENSSNGQDSSESKSKLETESQSKSTSSESKSESESETSSSPPPPTEENQTSPPPAPSKDQNSSPPPPSSPPPEKPASPPPEKPASPPPEKPATPPPKKPATPPPKKPAPPKTPTLPPPSPPVVPVTPAPPVTPNVVLAPPNIPVPPAKEIPPNNNTNLPLGPPPSPPPPASAPTTNDHPQVQQLVIGGAVAGTVMFLIFAVICFFCCCKPKKKKKKQDFQDLYWQYKYVGKDHTVNMPPLQQSPMAGGVYGWTTPHTTTGPGGGTYTYVPTSANETITTTTGIGTVTGTAAATTPIPDYLSKSAFTYDEMAAATGNFSQMNMLGQGGFGFVHKGILPNGKEVAVKSLKSGSGQGEREFQAEVEIISRVHHRHLVSLVGYCIAGSKRMLVYEFVPNDTLEHHLHKKSGEPLSLSMRVRIALGSAKGFAYLHEDCHPRIIHRDIKASNILLDSTFEAQVADFGLAKLTEDTNTHVSTRVMGTFGYLAPEYAASGKLTEKSDVFSYGVMLLELITGRRPVDPQMKYMEDSLVDWARPLLSKALDDGNYNELADPKLEGNYNHQEMAHMVACAAACIRHSAKKRPKMSQVVRALEGDMALDDLNAMAKKQDSSSGSDEQYDSKAYSDDLKKFRQMAFGSLDFTGVQSSIGSSSAS